MKEVYSTRNPVEAQLVRGLLESAGIKAVVENERLATGVGEIVEELVPSVCIVDDSQEDEAAAIIADWQHAAPDSPPWECPKCGEKIDGRFTACWECGTERPA